MPFLHSYYQDVYRCPIVRLDGYSAQHGLSTGILAYLDFGGATGSSKDGLAETMLAFATERGTLQPGIPFCPPEGDAGTGMVATNSVAPRTGNVSAGTSIFAMVVLEKPLSKVYPEIDMVTTPDGAAVAMVHCNNCTSDLNAWVDLLAESAALCGANVDKGALFTLLFNESLHGAPDCGGITPVNYISGESVTHLDAGVPLLLRSPHASARIRAQMGYGSSSMR